MKKIAIVEDGLDNRLLLQALLADQYQLSEYDSGLKALEGMRQEPPDLVLLDISLPELNGTDVLRRMREEETLERVPVIALTGHAMRGDKERLLASGFDEYFAKPLTDGQRLIDTIDRLLERGRPKLQ